MEIDEISRTPKEITINSNDTINNDNIVLTETETEMINYIVQENKAFFRSQQINDPDISESERKAIVTKVFTDCHKKFLYRFGKHIRADHLTYFEEKTTGYSADDAYEIQYYLRDIRTKMKNRQRDVKNRRYAAMQKMIADDDNPYFSEQEMMAREPLLYEHLVGQYLTDTEKKIRDNYDPNIEFSGVLLEGIAKRHIDELRNRQQVEEFSCQIVNDDDEDNLDYDTDEGDNTMEMGSGQASNPTYDAHTNGIINEDYYPQTPPSFKQHWGDFDENSCEPSQPSIIPSTSSTQSTQKVPVKDRLKQNYVTATEKELLKEEFIGIMHANFLSGKDNDFDYSTVDDNADYDNIELLAQDEEDKYFDADDDDEDESVNGYTIERSLEQNTISSDSEDELDSYMKKIENK